MFLEYTGKLLYLLKIEHTKAKLPRVREEQDTMAFDEQSSSLIRLNNGTVLYLREVNKFLALVCILREDNFEHKGTCLNTNNTRFIVLFVGIIDYNFLCFRKAIQQVFELRNKSLTPISNSMGSPMINGQNINEEHLNSALNEDQN